MAFFPFCLGDEGEWAPSFFSLSPEKQKPPDRRFFIVVSSVDAWLYHVITKMERRVSGLVIYSYWEGMLKVCHFSIEGILKGYLFCEKKVHKMVNLHPSISHCLNAYEDLPTLPTITYFVRALPLSFSVPVTLARTLCRHFVARL